MRTQKMLWVACALAVLGTAAAEAAAPAFKVLGNFDGANGNYPWDSLVQGTDGNFYGTTQNGGTTANGTVFRLTPRLVLKTLASFTGANGLQPYGGLVQGANGNFYGVTPSGGNSSQICATPYFTLPGCGTVFQITPGGRLTTLHNFVYADGAEPIAKLLLSRDGNFYGTTTLGGMGGGGTIFKMTPDGSLTTLWNFDYYQYGASASAALVQAANGDLVGTAFSGGGNNDGGVVFKFTPKGKFVLLHSFTGIGTEGYNPYGGLVIGADGNFYGTTWLGGQYQDYGTVFKLTPQGKLTTLHSFDMTDGDIPNAALFEGKNGNFYSTTSYGGTGNFGTVFEISPKGKFRTLHSFGSTDGAYAYGGLISGKDGLLYGNTWGGGSSTGGTTCTYGCGAIFSLPAGK